MRALAIALSAVLFLGVVALNQIGAQSALAQCADSNSVLLKQQGIVVPLGSGRFFYTMEASWDMRGTPFIGVPEAVTGTVGIEEASLTYFPAYFFPQDCSGSELIHVFGRTTDDPDDVHVVNTLLQLGPEPFYARTLLPVLIP